ncbi:hypothetical protein IHE44_0004422 [Lamprotornis superbus]|uniref:Uncharacterized protein n=1 Tax=Lamprotornis superbus TaxID=245042 RepID=A0A835ND68_9PASS|nr:hypothetical protein IHE44_0004422 [Lamprotornis superbus]
MEPRPLLRVWNLKEPKVHVTVRNLTEPRLHGGTARPLRSKESKVRDAQSAEMSNSSSISHFLLLPLADTRQLQLLHFCLFLAISLAALLANGLIISARHHRPGGHIWAAVSGYLKKEEASGVEKFISSLQASEDPSSSEQE